MARKHNVSKRGRRSPSNYKQRLVDRGLGKAPTMPSVESLRSRQLSKAERETLDTRQANDLHRTTQKATQRSNTRER